MVNFCSVLAKSRKKFEMLGNETGRNIWVLCRLKRKLGCSQQARAAWYCIVFFNVLKLTVWWIVLLFNRFLVRGSSFTLFSLS